MPKEQKKKDKNDKRPSEEETEGNSLSLAEHDYCGSDMETENGSGGKRSFEDASDSPPLTPSKASLAKSLEFQSGEECKAKVASLENEALLLCKEIDMLKEKAREKDRYSRRWNLRIKGLKELCDCCLWHRFALARPDICGRWLAAIKRRNFKPTKYSNICSQHFTRDCFKHECNNHVLKDNAVSSLYTSSRLQTEVTPRLTTQHLLRKPSAQTPLSLPMSDAEETPAEHPSEAQPGPDHSSTFVSCDHNYTVENTVQQKRSIEKLQEQLKKLRKRLKTVQQKCRRQERQLKRFRAMRQVQKPSKDTPLGDGYVILPKEIYDVLRGIETVGAL
ncbi:THAP domain-containing protein 1-like [Carassius carassius]|uniref:THAP domain-containing protein 1-like n=1 Tax=Carassius carassius TaxID=217509 RepID=UPI00286859C1|nr:THAP domain-containing protein 1-like [Carassius carassius]